MSSVPRVHTLFAPSFPFWTCTMMNGEGCSTCKANQPAMVTCANTTLFPKIMMPTFGCRKWRSTMVGPVLKIRITSRGAEELFRGLGNHPGPL